LLLENATLQVAFYADLVTLADPTSRFSFLTYLKSKGRLIAFGILENNYITRTEYNHYCRWVAGQLDNLYFDHKIEAVYYDDLLECYQLQALETMTGKRFSYYARKLVLGIGSVPYIPFAAGKYEDGCLFHSGDYLYHRESLFQKKSVTIIGSGQSAAEIMDDLLPHCRQFTGGYIGLPVPPGFIRWIIPGLPWKCPHPCTWTIFITCRPGKKKSFYKGRTRCIRGSIIN
jgi:lysine N6-hydroxylase